MKLLLITLAVSELLIGSVNAQDPSPPAPAKPGDAGDSTPAQPAAPDPAAYYVALNRRLIELKAQSDLLSQLAQEHGQRASQAAGDQAARAQWESDLAKEFSEKSRGLAVLLNDARKERLEFEQAHPEVLASVPANSPAAGRPARSSDELAFMGKLEERLAAVQREIAGAIEVGQTYSAQLRTNTASADFSRIASLLQDNASQVRQLQKEASDLELKRLEFQALRRD